MTGSDLEEAAVNRFALTLALLFACLLLLSCGDDTGDNTSAGTAATAETTDTTGVPAASTASRTSSVSDAATETIGSLEELQTQISFPVLAPTYYPAGLKLNPESIEIIDLSVLNTNPYKAYVYTVGQGNARADFLAPRIGPAVSPHGGAMFNIRDGVRGHKAIVYTFDPDFIPGAGTEPASISFEQSVTYLVVWTEGEDLTDETDINGAYQVTTHDITWDEVLKMLNSLEPVD